MMWPMHTTFLTDSTNRVALIDEAGDWYVAPVAPVRGIVDAWELEAPYSGPFPSRDAATSWQTGRAA